MGREIPHEVEEDKEEKEDDGGDELRMRLQGCASGFPPALRQPALHLASNLFH